MMTTTTDRTAFDLAASLYAQASKEWAEAVERYREFSRRAEDYKQAMELIEAETRLQPIVAEAKNEGDRQARSAGLLANDSEYGQEQDEYDTYKHLAQDANDTAEHLLQQIALARRQMDFEVALLRAMEGDK